MSTKKSGWLQKYSGTVFKSWKRRYCVLYSNGEFSVYDQENKTKTKTNIQMKSDCNEIGVGYSCGGIDLPKGQQSVDVLFCVKTKQGQNHYFAAASERECKEWTSVLEAVSNVKIKQSATPYPTQQSQQGASKCVATPPQQPKQPAYPRQQQQFHQQTVPSASGYAKPSPNHVKPATGCPRPRTGNLQPSPSLGYPQAGYGGKPIGGHGMPHHVHGQQRFGNPQGQFHVQQPFTTQQESSNKSSQDKDMMLGGLAGFALGSQMAGGLGNHAENHGHFGAAGGLAGFMGGPMAGGFGHNGLGHGFGNFGNFGFGHECVAEGDIENMYYARTIDESSFN